MNTTGYMIHPQYWKTMNLGSLSTNSIPEAPSFDNTTGNTVIHDEQYFGNVPLKAWEFYIGGYQPAETGSKTVVIVR